MTRGLIFDVESRHRRFFDVFVDTGDLRYVKARPSHVFRDGDFRPIKNWAEEEPVGSLKSVKGDVKEIMEKASRGLPKPLEKMAPSWLKAQKKVMIIDIARKIGIRVETEDQYTHDQLVNIILHQKELQKLEPIPETVDPVKANVVPEEAAGMVGWGDDDLKALK